MSPARRTPVSHPPRADRQRYDMECTREWADCWSRISTWPVRGSEMQMRAGGTLVRPHALLQRFRNVRRGIDIFVQFRYLSVTTASSRRRRTGWNLHDACGDRKTEYIVHCFFYHFLNYWFYIKFFKQIFAKFILQSHKNKWIHFLEA